MKWITLTAMTGLALSAYSLNAAARSWFDLEPMMWKAVRAAPGEGAWHACRRHFRNDATRATYGPPGIVYCYVPYYYQYGPGQTRQNFNR